MYGLESGIPREVLKAGCVGDCTCWFGCPREVFAVVLVTLSFSGKPASRLIYLRAFRHAGMTISHMIVNDVRVSSGLRRPGCRQCMYQWGHIRTIDRKRHPRSPRKHTHITSQDLLTECILQITVVVSVLVHSIRLVYRLLKGREGDFACRYTCNWPNGVNRICVVCVCIMPVGNGNSQLYMYSVSHFGGGTTCENRFCDCWIIWFY